MEKIVFTQTVPCRECRGMRYPERYNDSQSPCYHCPSITTRHVRKAEKTYEEKFTGRQMRDKKIMELRTSGKSYGEIAYALNMPRTTVRSVIKKYEQS